MSKEVFVTPKSCPVTSSLGIIHFPPYDQWSTLSLRSAAVTADQPETPWNPTMGQQVRNMLEGAKVDLAQGSQMQTYWGPIILLGDKFVPILTKFKGPHGRYLYAVHFEPWYSGQETPLAVLLHVLAENFIIISKGKVGSWHYEGNPLTSSLTSKYAEDLGLAHEPSLFLEISLYERKFKGAVLYAFGDKHPFRGRTLFYPPEGAILGLVPFWLKHLPTDVKIIAASVEEQSWSLPTVLYRPDIPWENLVFEAKEAVRAFVPQADIGE